MDAIEEALHDGDFHEIILSTTPHHISSWLHADLAHRVAHLGLPVSIVTAGSRPVPPAVDGGEPARLGQT